MSQSERQRDPSLIVLAAHGGGEPSPANEAIRALADRIEARLRIPTRAAFNLGDPPFAEVLDDAHRELPEGGPPEAIVIPVMLSRGWFATEKLPAELDNNATRSQWSLRITKPLGVDRSLLEAVVARTAGAVERFGLSRDGLSVLVVGHGTRRSRASSATTQGLAHLLRAELPDARVRDAYLDQEPLLEDIAADMRAGAGDILVVPWLLGGAGHELNDVRERLGVIAPQAAAPFEALTRLGADPADAGAQRRIVFERPILEEPTLDDLVAQLAKPARAVRIGTRGSDLAMWQARAAREAITRAGAHADIITFETSGDRDLATPVELFGKDDLFTDEIESALLAGAIDIAQHSLKDLPLTSDGRLSIGAVLARGPIEEGLVSRGQRSLADLPSGARVGTSSAKRRAQLLRVRPDLVAVPIRGAVPERVWQVREGRFDATILAVAGLDRLGMAGEIAEVFELEDMMPAAGQGAIALQCRAGDRAMLDRLTSIGDEPTHRAVRAELAFARTVSGTELIDAVWAEIDHAGDVVLHARLISPDGQCALDVTSGGPDPERLGQAAGEELLARARSEQAWSAW